MSVVATRARPAAWELLRGSVRGDPITPSDPQYDQARVGYWAQFDDVLPSAVAFGATPADVAACLAFCQDNDIPAVPRSGGHSLGGYSRLAEVKRTYDPHGFFRFAQSIG